MAIHLPMPVSRILIANRGEIAERIIRSCQSLGIESVAVYSHADKHLPFVKKANQALPLGGSPASESYLNISKIMEACKKSGADAVHPGYGFLSENPDFAEALEKEGMVFIGPPAKTMRLMGDKISARRLMKEHGVPVVPGYDSEGASFEALLSEARRIGFPVMVKASAGGGGRGLRIVETEKDFLGALESAQSEAKNAFGDDRVFLEKFIKHPRHIEVQIFADRHGNLSHLYERECSLQRRHQKVLEESPSPALAEKERQALYEIALKAARAVEYEGAGTVEFIFSDETREFFFLEMNTRLQVEHPVTEMLTGLDLVAEQIRVAAGERLSFASASPTRQGHAIEARLYAEDPKNDFLPAPGKILYLQFPKGEGIRIDSGVESGSEISIYYDPMIAKLIVHAADRKSAIEKLDRSLAATVLFGVQNNIDFLRALLEDAGFREGRYSTHTIEKNFSNYSGPEIPQQEATEAAQIAALLVHKAAANFSTERGFPEELAGFRLW